MKKAVPVFILFVLLGFNIKAQSNFIIAGTQGGIFMDINPDTLISVPVQNGSNHKIYKIDINQDGIKDIQVEAYCNVSGTTQRGIQIGALNAATSFLLGTIDSTFNNLCPFPGWDIRKILKKISYADTIKEGNYVSSGYLGYFTNNPCVMAASGQWLYSNDHFIGVKYQTFTDTSFGWVKIDVSNYEVVLIKEFSLGTTLTDIHSNVDVNNFFTIYPNPSNSKIQVTADRNRIILINIYDLLGKEMISTKEKEIDISDLQNGIYFVQVKTNEGILTKKMVVQK